MDEKKNTHGGDRRSGTAQKTKKMFGYRYTEEEYKSMSEALEKLKNQTGNTTSKILHDLLVKTVNEIDLESFDKAVKTMKKTYSFEETKKELEL